MRSRVHRIFGDSCQENSGLQPVLRLAEPDGSNLQLKLMQGGLQLPRLSPIQTLPVEVQEDVVKNMDRCPLVDTAETRERKNVADAEVERALQKGKQILAQITNPSSGMLPSRIERPGAPVPSSQKKARGGVMHSSRGRGNTPLSVEGRRASKQRLSLSRECSAGTDLRPKSSRTSNALNSQGPSRWHSTEMVWRDVKRAQKIQQQDLEKDAVAEFQRVVVKEAGESQRMIARERRKQKRTYKHMSREKLQEEIKDVIDTYKEENFGGDWEQDEYQPGRHTIEQMMLKVLCAEDEPDTGESMFQKKAAKRLSVVPEGGLRRASRFTVPRAPWDESEVKISDGTQKGQEMENNDAQDAETKEKGDDEAEDSGKGKQRKSRWRGALKPTNARDVRIMMLERLTDQASSEKKLKKLMALRRKQFETLPHRERDSLHKAFSKYDHDGGGTLDIKELKGCLIELGLKPKRSLEKKEVNMIVQEHLVCCGSVDFYNFCFDLVPRVRQRLNDIRRGPLFETFIKYDIDSSGMLDHCECEEIARSLCSHDLDEKSGKRLFDCFEEIYERVKEPGTDGEVDFEGFQVLLNELTELYQRFRKERQNYIRETCDLSSQTMHKYQEELITIHETFERADLDDSGELDTNEILCVLREYGLLSKQTWEEQRMTEIMRYCDANSDGCLCFREFLDLVDMARDEHIARMRGDLRQMFDRYDRDRSGALAVHEVSALFSELDLLPKCRDDQDEIKRLIDEVDEDGSGELDFSEFVHLVSRVTERLKSMERRRQYETAVALGFDNKQIHELRESFFALDEDGDQQLTLEECRRVIVMCRKKIAWENLDALFYEMDKDDSGAIEFEEFLHLMKRIEGM